MGMRDVVVLNTTSSRLEVQQSNDSVRILGDSNNLLSVENTAGTPIFSINAQSQSADIAGSVVVTGDLSSSLASSSSFGRLESTTLIGSAANMTNTDFQLGIVSSSQQMASEISGAFDSGFEFTGTIGKAVGVFSAGGALINANKEHTGTGLRNAALQFGGSPSSTPGQCTEEYNGTAWSVGGAKITAAYYMGSAGYLTSALSIGGLPDSDETEKYDGTAWSETGNMITGRRQLGSTGTQNAAIAFGGRDPSASSCTETFNGSTWSEVADMISARCRFGSAGSQNSALAFGGQPNCTCTEEWDGGSWSTAGALLIGTTGMAGGGVASTVNAAISIGGGVAPGAYSEEYNGTSWSVGGTLIQCRNDFGAGGSQDSIVAFGGCVPAASTCTEEYDGFLPVSASFGKLVATTISADASGLDNTGLSGTVSGSTQIASDVSGSFQSGFEFTGTIGQRTGVWSSGTALPTATRAIVGVGSKNAAMFFGGNTGGSSLSTNHHYNGTSWSAGGSLITATQEAYTAGTEYAALSAGGNFSNPLNTTQEYYGETWATSGNLSTGKGYGAGFGLQNAALAVGGRSDGATPAGPRNITNTEQYDGSTWSEVGDLNTGVDGLAGAGTINAGIVFGGQKGPSPFPIINCTEQYNGSSWSVTTGMITSRLNHGGSGLQNAAIAFGGQPGPVFGATTEEWNGTAWSTSGALSTARYSSKDFTADAHNAIMAGGRNPGTVSCTETYTGFNVSASFGRLNANTISGDISSAEGANDGTGIVSASSQLATDISGSFDSGFEFTGTLGIRGGVWSAGGDMIIGKINAVGFGLENAALSLGGQSPSQLCTEHYNGTSWSSGGTPANGCYGRGGDGTEYAGIVFGGYHPAPNSSATEEYYGETFAAGGALSTGRGYLGGAGTQNAAIAFGGFTPSVTDVTEEYNGTSWSSGGSMINTRGKTEGTGAQNAGLAVGGYNPTNLSATEHYDGTAWCAGGDMSAGRKSLSVTGIENDALRVGGSGGTKSEVEHYDGVAWSIGGSKNNDNHCAGAAAGTRTNGLYFGGGNPGTGLHECTEHYESYVASASFGKVIASTLSGDGGALENLIPSSFVSSSEQIASDISGSFIQGFEVSGDIRTDSATPTGSALNAFEVNRSMLHGRTFHAAFGDAEAGAVVGGINAALSPSPTRFLDSTHEYDGINYTVGGALITARFAGGSAGSQNAGLYAGGADAPNSSTSCNEHYNGTSWSAGGTLPQNVCAWGNCNGTQNAALIIDGRFPNSPASPGQCSFEYDGTTWTKGGVLNMEGCRSHFAYSGVQNSALMIGGIAPTSPNDAAGTVEEYDGTVWTLGTTLPLGFSSRGICGGYLAAAGGSTNSALAVGGNQHINQCYGILAAEYDGTTWTYRQRLGSGLTYGAGAGRSLDRAFFTGGSSTYNQTGEFSGLKFPTSDPHVASQSINYIPTVSTGSFGTLNVRESFIGDGKNLDNILPDTSCKLVYNVNQIIEDVTGSFAHGFEFTGNLGYKPGTWTSGPDTVVNHCRDVGSSGTATAALLAGGTHGNATSASYETEEYDGSTWSQSTRMIASRRCHGMLGSQNSSMVFAGEANSSYLTGHVQTFPTCSVEFYNGSTWAAGPNLPSNFGASQDGVGCTHDEALLICFNQSFSFNGTTFAEEDKLHVNTSISATVGNQNDALRGAGNPGLNLSETWDGTTWSINKHMLTKRRGHCAFGSGTNMALFHGSAPGADSGGKSTGTEMWNGTTWSIDASMTLGRTWHGGSTQSPTSNGLSGLAVAGAAPTSINGAKTELYEGHYHNVTGSFKCLDAGEVFIGGNPQLFVDTSDESIENTAKLEVEKEFNIPTFTTCAATASYGEVWINPEDKKLYFTYGGSWTTANPQSGDDTRNIGFGTSICAAVAVKGNGKTEEYNGIVWSSNSPTTNLNVARYFGWAWGTYESAVLAGGNSPNSQCTEEWNGTSWSAGGALGNSRLCDHGAGSSVNTGLMFGKNHPSSDGSTESYNGTTWSDTGHDLITPRFRGAGSGTENAALMMGGCTPSKVACTEEYNGSSWANGGALPLALAGYGGPGAGTGTQNDSIFYTGGRIYHSSLTDTGMCTPSFSQSSVQMYNGTSWSAAESLTYGRQWSALAGGSSRGALATGGYAGVSNQYPSGYEYDTSTFTEEYHGPEIHTVEIG